MLFYRNLQARQGMKSIGQPAVSEQIVHNQFGNPGNHEPPPL